jgi:hypothetical protein
LGILQVNYLSDESDLIIHYLKGPSSGHCLQKWTTDYEEDYPSPSDDGADLQRSENDTSDPSDHPKRAIKMTERAR